MVSNSDKAKALKILFKMANSQKVSLKERLFVKDVADLDSSFSNKLTYARRKQQKAISTDNLDELISELNIGNSEPCNIYKKDSDEIEKWFTGAPKWLTRS